MKTHTHKYMYIYKFKQNLWNIFFLPNFTEISRLKNRGKFAAAFDLVCRPMCEYNDGTIESTTRIRIRNCLAYIYIYMYAADDVDLDDNDECKASQTKYSTEAEN